MKNLRGSPSLNYSNTVVADYIYLNHNNTLTNLNDLLQTSSGISASNLIDNSITSIVLSDICYNSIADARLTLNTNDVIYNSPLYHTFNVNNSNVFTIGENDIDVYGNIVSVADISTIGNINCNTLNSIGISNYLTNNILTDNSIGGIVVDNVCYADVIDPRITLNVNDTNITAPTNLNLKVGNATVATLNSTQTQDNSYIYIYMEYYKETLFQQVLYSLIHFL